MIRKYGYDIGYMGLINYVANPHLHLCMVLEKVSHSDRSLGLDIDIMSFVSEWRSISHRDAVIDAVNDQKGLCGYVAYQNTPSCGAYELVEPVGTSKILKRFYKHQGG
mgnify:CR=1 FL=1